MSQVTMCAKTSMDIIDQLRSAEVWSRQETKIQIMEHLFSRENGIWNELVNAAKREGLVRKIPQVRWQTGQERVVGSRTQMQGRTSDGKLWTLVRVNGGMRLTIWVSG